MKYSKKAFLLLYLPIIIITTLSIGKSHGQSYDCQNTTTNTFAKNSIFNTNLNSLLSSLSSNANQTAYGYYNTTVGSQNNTVYGLFLCRGDFTPATCQACVSKTTKRVLELCPNLKQAFMWYDNCLVRYSDQYFFGEANNNPVFGYYNTGNASELSNFNKVWGNTIIEVTAEAANGGDRKKYATKEINVSSFETLYSLAQCTPDIEALDCESCLSQASSYFNGCCGEHRGGGAFTASCYFRIDLYPFYRQLPSPPPPNQQRLSPPPQLTSFQAKGKALSSRSIIIIVVVLLLVAVMLSCIAYCFLRRKRIKNYKYILKENFGSESTTLESLQFSLATIEAATNKFSNENRIGKGGFGQVYKGILSDGREIAIKRLSKTSGQGVAEFKNEILLIAKLQHRNLVTLLGFCLDKEEKILLYEYVPNKSLDYFLFGSQRYLNLNWEQRYKIINGTARGIHYLHEHSRLKVIHRDLKPSNILLDDKMNPKISDFGLAKMVAINETEGSTNRIVGTYGYMSPEYAMLGQYSEKSDIFSFGVIVLEIVSGKKNISSHDSQYADGLLSYAWKQWRDDKLSDILDSNLTELESYKEVFKCIQIGLLCVQENPDARPSMGTIVSYLSNDLIQLPYPQEPAFFMHGRMELTIGRRESSSDPYTNSSKSVNEMSLSTFFPR